MMNTRCLIIVLAVILLSSAIASLAVPAAQMFCGVEQGSLVCYDNLNIDNVDFDENTECTVSSEFIMRCERNISTLGVSPTDDEDYVDLLLMEPNAPSPNVE